MLNIANYLLTLPTPIRYPKGSRADLQLNDSFGSLGSRSKTTLTRIILIAKRTNHQYIQGTGELHSFVSVSFDLRNSTGFTGQFWNARELRALQKRPAQAPAPATGATGGASRPRSRSAKPFAARPFRTQTRWGTVLQQRGRNFSSTMRFLRSGEFDVHCH